MTTMIKTAGGLAGLLLASMVATTPALAKLPAPSDEAKAKAAEAAAKAAHGGKVENYRLCLAMDRVAAGYQAAAKKAGKAASAPTETPACADPGPFVYAPPGAASAPVAAAPAAPAATPAAVAKK
jgi:hypothetical protein